MSVQISLVHSVSAGDVGLCNGASHRGLKNLGLVQCSGHVFTEHKKGEKGLLRKCESLVQYRLQVILPKERRRQPSPTNIPGLPRHILSLSSADNGLNDKRSSGRSNGGRFQHLAREEDIRLQRRAGRVKCSPDKDEVGKGFRVWKDGPNGVVWEAEEIAQAVGGVVVTSGSPGSISTDSRKLNQGEWFLALSGPNFDGHRFLQQALDRGCAGVIGRAVTAEWPRGFVRVEDDTVITTLQRLAASVRGRYGGAVVGITGSTGKTTARAMTALALESLGPIHQSEGNFNNHIGLPLTLLKLPSTASACVLEMGMNHSGEIRVLAQIARPSLRVLLNVGAAHMEHFGSLEDVAAAKGELLSDARPGDICVLNADDPLVMSLPIPRGTRVVLFGRQEGCHLKIADAHATRRGRAVQVVLEQSCPGSTLVQNSSSGSQILGQLTESSSKSKVNESPRSGTRSAGYQAGHGSNLQPRICYGSGSIGLASDQDSTGMKRCSPSSGLNLLSTIEFEIPSPGLHLAVNACAAAAVAVSLGVPLQTAGQSISKYSPIGMRSRWEEVGKIQLIDDAYNSNPMSIESALTLLGSMECQGRRVALLGDMLELGSVSKKAHLDALAHCQELNLDMVGLVGRYFSEAACSHGLDKEKHVFMICQDSQELAAKFVEIVRPGDVVLVKGSRGMKMEITANAIRTSDWAG